MCNENWEESRHRRGWELSEAERQGEISDIFLPCTGAYEGISGACPYGFMWKDKKLVQHPTEAPIRLEAFELFLKLRRKGAVARELNKQGHRTRQGRSGSTPT